MAENYGRNLIAGFQVGMNAAAKTYKVVQDAQDKKEAERIGEEWAEFEKKLQEKTLVAKEFADYVQKRGGSPEEIARAQKEATAASIDMLQQRQFAISNVLAQNADNQYVVDTFTQIGTQNAKAIENVAKQIERAHEKELLIMEQEGRQDLLESEMDARGDLFEERHGYTMKEIKERGRQSRLTLQEEDRLSEDETGGILGGGGAAGSEELRDLYDKTQQRALEYVNNIIGPERIATFADEHNMTEGEAKEALFKTTYAKMLGEVDPRLVQRSPLLHRKTRKDKLEADIIGKMAEEAKEKGNVVLEREEPSSAYKAGKSLSHIGKAVSVAKNLLSGEYGARFHSDEDFREDVLQGAEDFVRGISGQPTPIKDRDKETEEDIHAGQGTGTGTEKSPEKPQGPAGLAM